MKKELIKLSSLGGISGFEYTISEDIKSLLYDFCDETYDDVSGNVVGIIRSGKKNAKKVMIEAHIDGIGLMVKDIDEKGFISFVPIGGIDSGILPYTEVIVYGEKKLFGVIAAKSPAVLSDSEQNKKYPISELAIDVGMSAEDVKKYIKIGDMITFASGAKKLSSKVFSGKYFDDRAGLITLLIALKKLKNISLDFDIYVLCATCEEVGLRGAKTGSYSIEPDCAVVVDVCHGKTPDSGSDSVFELGSGAVISKGPNIHPFLSTLAENVAKSEKIKYNIDVDGGDTGTDAWAVQVTKSSIPTLLLSIPLRYMHTTIETLSYTDLDSIGNLIAAILKNLDLEELSCTYQL
ncbi:MAG: M42 family metallopeptidase [Ruminococcaceae bacterium]|nr:M42 family metallopeptidase [Oscillospiraceae bacterium]